jgi:uncharacterized HAD superfamily protein
MKIGIDIDNVIANTFIDLAMKFNQYMGKEMAAEEVVRVMRKEKFKMYGYWFVTWRDKLLTQVTPIAGASATLKKWHKDHHIVLVTSRQSMFNRQTKDWLKFHDMPYHELHHSKELKKHLKAPDCDIFLEDNIDECEVLADHVEKVYLFDQPWNRREHNKKNIHRVKGWEELRSL